MPPNWRTMVSTLRIGSGLAEPGVLSTPASSALRASGSFDVVELQLVVRLRH